VLDQRGDTLDTGAKHSPERDLGERQCDSYRKHHGEYAVFGQNQRTGPRCGCRRLRDEQGLGAHHFLPVR
jgi:hypothetical protein